MAICAAGPPKAVNPNFKNSLAKSQRSRWSSGSEVLTGFHRTYKNICHENYYLDYLCFLRWVGAACCAPTQNTKYRHPLTLLRDRASLASRPLPLPLQFRITTRSAQCNSKYQTQKFAEGVWGTGASVPHGAGVLGGGACPCPLMQFAIPPGKSKSLSLSPISIV